MPTVWHSYKHEMRNQYELHAECRKEFLALFPMLLRALKLITCFMKTPCHRTGKGTQRHFSSYPTAHAWVVALQPAELCVLFQYLWVCQAGIVCLSDVNWPSRKHVLCDSLEHFWLSRHVVCCAACFHLYTPYSVRRAILVSIPWPWMDI